MELWRLSRIEHAPGLDGEGARLFGGRWNSPGIPVVYTASSLSLAVVETFVHLLPEERTIGRFPKLVATLLWVPDEQVERHMLYPLETEQARKAGDEWARSHQSLALSVKSHVVPPDRNVLLNPVHPAFSMVTVLQQDSFKLDDRMAF